ncbi:MAG: amidohydrolase family protein [Promethearchaeota archaeon]
MNLLIKDGIIIDGTSSSRFKADILIKDEKIHKIAQNIEQNADHIINANGKIVSPGFIDMHHHGDLMILEVPKAESSIMQGCTTLVVGVCGLSLAPSNDLIKDYYQNFVSNAFGMKGIHLYNNFQDLMLF